MLARLRAFLMLRGPRQRLARAGVAHPFAADVAAAVAAWNRAARRNPPGPARACGTCGIAIGLHPRCRRCPQLLGILHEQPLAPDGHCHRRERGDRRRPDPRVAGAPVSRSA